MPTIPIEVQRLMNKAKLTKGLPLQPKKNQNNSVLVFFILYKERFLISFFFVGLVVPVPVSWQYRYVL
jgi:hypothetical protein